MLTSTSFIPTKVFQQNDWTVTMLDERVYLIRDASGNECKVPGYRVVSSDELAIVHPVFPDILVNTRRFKTLPVSCRGDLTDPDTVEDQRSMYTDTTTPWRGPRARFVNSNQRDAAHRVYHGSNAPSD